MKSEEELGREQKAIKTFVAVFGGSFKKLDPLDVDYKVFDKEGRLIAYVEVTERFKTLKQAFPLSVAATKIAKLIEKRLNPVLVWSCEDGIIYGKAFSLMGEIKRGGFPPRSDLSGNCELMVYYEAQKPLKYIRYV